MTLRTLALLTLLTQSGGSGANPDSTLTTGNPNHPFSVGERFQYSAKLGVIRLGTASMEVAGIETIRGAAAYHFRFHLTGGNFAFKLDNVNESWTRVSDLVSLRFRQIQNESRNNRVRHFEIHPDSGFYRQDSLPETRKTPPRPVDDAAIVYFLRTFRLEPGKAYRFENYFKAEKNPLIVRVHKREELELPDGRRVPCIVIQPMIGDDGLFSNRSDARIWFTDDERRIPVQIRSRFPWGTITLRLEAMELAGNGAN